MPCPLSRLPDGPGKGEFCQSSLLDRKLTHSRAESVPKVSHCIAWTQTADLTGPFSVAGSPELLASSSRERACTEEQAGMVGVLRANSSF